MPGTAVEIRMGQPEGNPLSGFEVPEFDRLDDLSKKLSLGALHWLDRKKAPQTAEPTKVSSPAARESASEWENLPENLQGLGVETVRDLLTDASERLPFYMEHGFTYSLNERKTDLLTDSGLSVNQVLQDGLAAARLEAPHDPRWQDELRRRELEWQQHEEVIGFAKENGDVTVSSFSLDGGNRQRGWYGEAPLRALIAELAPELDIRSLEDAKGRLDPNKLLGKKFESQGALWFISMTPMHVRESGQALDGAYDPVRLKSLVRVVTPATEDTASTLIRDARMLCDEQLQKHFDGEWYGGRHAPQVTAENSLNFILGHPNLISQHLKRVKEVMNGRTSDEEKAQLLDRLQYDFIAAIDSALEGKEVVSLEQAGQEARAAGKTYEGDCATKKLTAEEQLRILGLFRGKKPCCPFCNSPDIKVDPLDPVCGDKSCNNCGSEVIQGKVIQRSRHLGKAAMSRREEKAPKAPNIFSRKSTEKK